MPSKRLKYQTRVHWTLARRDIWRLAHPIYVVRQNLYFLANTIASTENLSKQTTFPLVWRGSHRCQLWSLCQLEISWKIGHFVLITRKISIWFSHHCASSTSGSGEPGRLSDVKPPVRAHDGLSRHAWILNARSRVCGDEIQAERKGRQVIASKYLL